MVVLLHNFAPREQSLLRLLSSSEGKQLHCVSTPDGVISCRARADGPAEVSQTKYRHKASR